MSQDKESLEMRNDSLQNKGPQIRCIPHGRWRLAHCKSTCEEHAGSDKSFENVTLCLDRKNFRITPFINNAFCLINYASALLSSKTMVNSPEYCIYTSVMSTYWVNKRGFQFLSFFLSFSTPLFLFFPPLHSPTTLSSATYLHPNMVKNANFRGLRRIWEFLPTLRGVIILPPRQPRL